MYFVNRPETPFFAVAAVDAVVQPTQLLWWETQFEPEHVTDNLQDLTATFSTDPPIPVWDNVAAAGGWEVSAVSGVDADHPIYVAWRTFGEVGEPFATLTALNTPLTLTIPPSEHRSFYLFQTTATDAVVELHQQYGFTAAGEMPTILPTDRTLTVCTFATYPRYGTLTAYARLYDAEGELLASSNALELTFQAAPDT